MRHSRLSCFSWTIRAGSQVFRRSCSSDTYQYQMSWRSNHSFATQSRLSCDFFVYDVGYEQDRRYSVTHLTHTNASEFSGTCIRVFGYGFFFFFCFRVFGFGYNRDRRYSVPHSKFSGTNVVFGFFVFGLRVRALWNGCLAQRSSLRQTIAFLELHRQPTLKCYGINLVHCDCWFGNTVLNQTARQRICAIACRDNTAIRSSLPTCCQHHHQIESAANVDQDPTNATVFLARR